ncbi:hypothetical protein [Novosphingobium sp. 9U]|uniref:hypothetical protein n=1 Tax=Novosphingobium sp. 9U TaxID=2653158 RepID=UPI0012F32E26|nr:hypothetical protein [Novosphingobium sp. 9U]VWX55209.1 hypothetical protein NOVOSPHI9U_800006 [Novosphingobium sp. 9U]
MGGVTLFNSPRPNGSQTVYMRTSTADTNSVSVKSSGCKIAGGRPHNKNTSEAVFKLYNRTAAPAVGTDTIYLKMPGAAGQVADLQEIFSPTGIYLGTGCG